MLCPSTFTLVSVCFVFTICTIRWSFFNWDFPIDIMPMTITVMIVNLKWTRILESLQMSLPLSIWTCYAAKALIDPWFKWAMPAAYARLAENQKARWRRGKNEDVEARELRPIDEQSPLSG